MTITLNGTTGIQNVLGSAAAPAESNTTSSNTGVYFPTSTSVGISTAGVNAVTVDASQNVTMAGTATATKLIPSGSSAPTNGMFLPAANTVGFATNSTERARIDSSGNLCVGTTGAQGLITAAATGSNVGIYVSAVNTHGVFSLVSNTGYGFYGRSASASYGGVIGFDSNNTSFGILGYVGYGLYSNVSINVAGTVYTSDRRLKENDQNITNALSKVMQLRAVSFDWKADSSRGIQKGGVVPDYGFIAQEIESILPDLVYSANTPARPAEMTSPMSIEEQLGEYKGIDYSRFVPFLTAAIQEQQALITSLTDRIAALEAR